MSARACYNCTLTEDRYLCEGCRTLYEFTADGRMVPLRREAAPERRESAPPALACCTYSDGTTPVCESFYRGPNMRSCAKCGHHEACHRSPLPSAERPYQHDFREYIVCRHCGMTEAGAAGECHHCGEKPGRCWWCLRLPAEAPRETPPPFTPELSDIVNALTSDDVTKLRTGHWVEPIWRLRFRELLEAARARLLAERREGQG